MNWFLTGDSLGIASHLEGGGQNLMNSTSSYRDIEVTEDPSDYPLHRYLRHPSHKGTQVLLLDQIFEPPGYARKHVLSWGGAVKGRCVVGVSNDDPNGFDTFKRAWRGCIIGLSHIGVYVTTDRAVANAASVSLRVVFWEGDAAPLLQAAADCCNYKRLAGVPRIYTTTGQHTSI